MTGDVLRRHPACALRESFAVTGLFVGGEFAFRMRVEVGAITIKRESQQQLRVHLGRWNLLLHQATNGGG